MKKLKNESRSAVVGTVIIILAMIIAFGAVFVWMYSVDLLMLPDFVEDIFGLDDDTRKGNNKNELSEIVKPYKELPDSSISFDVTYDNLKTAFITDRPDESFYLSANVSYYSGNTPSTRRVDLYKHGDSFRVEMYKPGDSEALEELKVCNGESMTVTHQSTGIGRKLSLASGLSPENEAGIPTVRELIKMVEKFPESPDTDTADTKQGELSSCVIKLIKEEKGNIYYIAFTEPELSISEEYYVSLESGMVTSHVTKVGGAVTYSYELTKYSDNSEICKTPSLYEIEDELKTADEH